MPARAAKTHVLVGADGSESARAAVEWALGAAILRGGRLTVLRVGEPDEPTAATARAASSSSATPRPRTPGTERMPEIEDLASRRGTSRVRVDGLTLHGRPERILTQEAATADLLVVGSGKKGGLLHTLMGSVCRHVVTHSASPVAVVSAGWQELAGTARATRGPVVVGVDGSEASQHAVLWAARHARASGAPLALVHAYPRSGSGGQTPPTPRHGAAVEAAEHAEHVLRVSRHVAERELAGSPVPLSTETRQGSAGTALADATAGARLLVLGAHSGRLPSHRLGRVLRACLDRASCPVVVVPTGVAAPEPSPAVSAWTTRRS